jgi:N-acetyl-gamma-glutamylphosphate reductase
MPSILLFGATGLVGSHLILDLKTSHPNYPITLYLRNAKLDSYLTTTASAAKIVHGTFDETNKISALAAEHDIVINVGSSWDVGLSEAIIAGLKKEGNGEGKVLIHMSGTGNWVDETFMDGSSHESTKIWDVSLPLLRFLVNGD